MLAKWGPALLSSIQDENVSVDAYFYLICAHFNNFIDLDLDLDLDLFGNLL